MMTAGPTLPPPTTAPPPPPADELLGQEGGGGGGGGGINIANDPPSQPAPVESRAEARDGGIAAFTFGAFCKLWGMEFPYIKVVPSSDFAKCNSCIAARSFMENSARGTEQRGALSVR
jgi:hypothetical protein